MCMRRFIFRSEFEILDLDPPINATSHYGACHFSITRSTGIFPQNSLIGSAILKEFYVVLDTQIETKLKRDYT